MKQQYGDKRDYPKIDIYFNGDYICSTTWARTLKEAVKHYFESCIIARHSLAGATRTQEYHLSKPEYIKARKATK